ncbi:VOC family protein [Natroniella sp. ANB-PHB2]|uniref:VOC family protein n=1 Tax=Natroniella sp. ANB-PHB2 TaxID=3384444 RepID=UPI0038D501A8
MIKDIFSSQLVVSDLERSIEFYTEKLELKLIEKSTEPINDPELSEGINIPDASFKFALLKIGEEDLLELYEFINPKPETDEAVPFNSIGASRINFLVENIEDAKKELEAKGIEFYSPVNDFDGHKWVLFSDPDGIALELVQPDESEL